MGPVLFSVMLFAAALTAPNDVTGPAAVDAPRAGSFFSKYKENYFISGAKADQVKFQVSMKAELLTYATRSPDDHIGAYFAYTQKSFWDMWALDRSSPFLENNYAPELFVGNFKYRGKPARKRLDGLQWLHYRIGFEHESNGESGGRSRSWNRPYAAFQFGYFSGDWYAVVTPLAYYPVGLRDNPDIAKFLGYGELNITLGHERLATEDFGGLSIGATMTQGEPLFRRPGIETTGVWRLGWPGSWFGVSLGFAPALYAQWYEGYGESLLAYDRYQRSFRLGFSLEDRYADPRVPGF